MGYPLISNVITVTICCLGIIGNVLCAIVLFSKHMGRTSYIYLLQGLAISDTCLLSLSLYLTLDHLGVAYLPKDVYTLGVVFFWSSISSTATKYFTVAVAMERFFVIKYPLAAHTYMTLGRAKSGALGIFGFSVVASVFSYIYRTWLHPTSYPFYQAIVFNFLPFFAVVTFNVLTIFGLKQTWKSRAVVRKTSPRATSASEEESNVTIMLITVALVFGVCYSFETVRRVMTYIWPEYMTQDPWPEYTINNLSDVFFVLNSSVNFIIYAVLGRHFRAVFAKLFLSGLDASGGSGTTTQSASLDKTLESISKV